MEELSFENIEGKVIDEFEILEQIGKGASSRVHMALHLPTKNYCAAKIIDLHLQTTSAFEGITREISVFMQVSHPNVAKLFRLSQVGNFLIFFMEIAANGTLRQYVLSKKGLNEGEAYRVFSQLFTAFYYIHYKHFIVHRDIKMENILLDENNDIKVVDFGLSDTFYGKTLRGVVGTPGYTAPEVLVGGEYNEKCDVWSLGVTLYCLITTHVPFSSYIRDARRLIEEVSQRPKLTGVSQELEDLITCMLEPQPLRRPTIVQLTNHPWFRGAIQILKNVSSRPVVFYKVPSYSDVLKFRRRPEGIMNDIAEKCIRLGISKDRLIEELKNGEITNQTTTYFVLFFSTPVKPAHLSVRLPPLSKRPIPTKERMQKNGMGSVRLVPYQRFGKRKFSPKMPQYKRGSV